MFTEITKTFLEEHPLFTFANDVQLICDEFFNKSKTTYFNCVKRYFDGSKVCLSNRADWMRYFYEKELFENITIERETINSEKPPVGRLLVVTWVGLNDSLVVKEQSVKFNIANGISLAFVHENHIEYYYFGTENKNTEMSNWYINNIGSLTRFIHHFKDKAKGIIKIASQPKNLIAIGKNANLISSKNCTLLPYASVDYIKPKHYFIYKDGIEILITSREMECVRYIARGYSCAQIGLALKISERTVEKHLENAREKLSCTSKHDLIGIILDSGLNSLISVPNKI